MDIASPRAWTRRAAIAAPLLWAGLAVLPARAATPPAPIVLGTDQPDNNFWGRWLRRVYGEAFKRLGIPLQVVHVPTQRLGALLDSGEIDGELARARVYQTAHPQAIRVDEWIIDAAFYLYTADPSLQLKQASELASGPLRVVYRRGVVFCERTFTPLVPPDRLLDVTGTEQGLSMLLNGRADAYCDIDSAVLQTLADGSLKGAAAIRKLLLLEPAPNFPYLHGRHAELAPRLAATLKQMKAEGLLERYRRELQQEVEAK